MKSVGILAVIVTYKTIPSNSPTLATILQAARMASSCPLRLSIFLADNSPEAQQSFAITENLRYKSYPDNPGLAKPYNDALEIARSDDFQWLLTLDQDTNLPSDFLIRLLPYIEKYRSNEVISTIVPRIIDEGRQISPFRFVGGFLPCVLPEQTRGISKRFCSALNSSSLHRVSSLQEIGGFDLLFRLHNSDTDLFQRLDKAGKRVVIAHDISVRHELSILRRDTRMTPERYRQNLLDECAFWDLRMSSLGRIERLVRLMGRAFKGYLQREDKVFQDVTISEIKRRLTTRRSVRIRSWMQNRSE